MTLAPSARPASVIDATSVERLKSLGYAAKGQYQVSGGEAEKRVRRYEIDPGMRGQTGPGTPTWSWGRVALPWQGAARAGQEGRLRLVSPLASSLPRLRPVA